MHDVIAEMQRQLNVIGPSGLLNYVVLKRSEAEFLIRVITNKLILDGDHSFVYRKL